MNYLRDAWRKIFCYTGRASREQYWMTILWQIISVFVFGLVTILLRMPMGLPFFVQEVVLGWLFYLLLIALVLYVMASFFMFLALIVRRTHDIGLSGWWVLIGLVPFIGTLAIFIFMVVGGNTGDNKYGPDPIKPIVISDLGTPVGGSMAFAVVLVVVITLTVAGGIWYYEVHSEQTNQSASGSSFSNNPAVPISTTSTVATSTPSTQSPSQPSAAVPTSWSQGRFSFTAPITGCFAFNYPPTFSNPVGDSTSDNNGNMLDYAVRQNVNFQEVEEIYKAEGYTEKDFTTMGDLAGKEFVLKNRTTIFVIFIPGSQQILIDLNFSHDSRMPTSSIDLGTEETIAQSVVFPCPSQ
jgi:uncharacterized membrane protein YhaH (DUF805 family)